MKTLPPNWFTEGSIDLEHKRYILLAYLQEVEQEYSNSRIFPALQNLIAQMTSMQEFKVKCETLENSFPKSISGMDLELNKIRFIAEHHDSELLETLYAILEYSIPKVESKIKEGKEIYDQVEQVLEIEPVGITPIYKDEGYLFLNSEGENEIEVYGYKMSFLQNGFSERVLQTKLLKRTKHSISNSFYAVKNSLIKEFKHLPNPATYLVKSALSFPKEATLLPIAKRLFMRKLVNDLV